MNGVRRSLFRRSGPALAALLIAGGTRAQTPAAAPGATAQPPAAANPAAPPAPQSAAASATPNALADRLGWNSRERTNQGIAALERGDAAGAKDALDTAHRLRPADPTATYNAGTGRLAAGDPTAAELLERAAREAPAALQPSAWYNLGEARLAARDPGGAVEAFVETLKRQPQHADAKHNLELALRELQKRQEQQQQQQQGGQRQEQQQDPNDQRQPDRQPDDGDSEPSNDPQPDPGEQDPQERDSKGQPDPKSPGAQGKPKPLPQFKDLADMTAEQAAAILRAVDNLERQQRKERAEKAAKAANAAVAIDW
jgi:hypothetical protein